MAAWKGEWELRWVGVGVVVVLYYSSDFLDAIKLKM
jgi:hypothetical protein